MPRRDWTPLVLAASTACMTIVLFILATNPWLTSGRDAGPGPERALRPLAPQVDIWVGEVAPGAKGVLSEVWGDVGPDEAHDQGLNERLGLEGGARLAWYRLLVFNVSAEALEIALDDGAIAIRPEDGRGPVTLRSVAGLVARGEAQVPPALASVLRAKGALSEQIHLPPGRMVEVLVAFERRVDLRQAEEVIVAQGGPFRHRRMARQDLEALIAQPDERRVRDL